MCLSSCVVNLQRLFCSQKLVLNVGIKAFCYTKYFSMHNFKIEMYDEVNLEENNSLPSLSSFSRYVISSTSSLIFCYFQWCNFDQKYCLQGRTQGERPPPSSPLTTNRTKIPYPKPLKHSNKDWMRVRTILLIYFIKTHFSLLKTIF